MFNNSAVQATLEKYYPKSAIRLMESNGTRFHALDVGETYVDASPVLRKMKIEIDRIFPISPAGLFVVEERTVFLRSLSPMTICHEAGHALDCALGGGVYLSGIDPMIRRAFAAATAFVTPYSASSCDEYAAENFRAFVEANDPNSPWPTVSRERLLQVDPTMFRIVSGLLADIERRFGDRPGEQLMMDFAA